MPPIPDPRTDQQLVAALNGGDATAFDALYFRYRDFVIRLARRFCTDENDALDVLQETFAYLLRKVPGFKLTSAMTSFLYPTVKHLAEAARRKRRQHASDDSQATNLAAPPVAPTDSRVELAAALSALPEPQREVLLLRFVDDLQLNEIADALGVPVGTVKSRLHHALETLKRDATIAARLKGE